MKVQHDTPSSRATITLLYLKRHTNTREATMHTKNTRCTLKSHEQPASTRESTIVSKSYIQFFQGRETIEDARRQGGEGIVVQVPLRVEETRQAGQTRPISITRG